ncbi:hypothetical protein [Rhizobacter sp. SG703]|uniref:hypothetical protein n=1 Tax=Rhizobacter sp. SG703 TaxID=2587140 RepID=UPI001445E3B0|nr:hypothetical protein [Rhizobacter sp. SG703]NKI94733.1 hypothetical protein [Rhizobacter sp. SG703]
MNAGTITVHDGRDTLERASEDDLVSVSEAAYLQAALVRHRLRAQQEAQALNLVRAPLGTCANCDSGCDPAARYCDPDCQSDHAQRVGRLSHASNLRA